MSAPSSRVTLHERVIATLEAGPATAQELACQLGVTTLAAHAAAWRLAQAGCCRRAGTVASPAGGRPRTVWEVEP
jgi:predicted ArsR family transcriptional regulator